MPSGADGKCVISGSVRSCEHALTRAGCVTTGRSEWRVAQSQSVPLRALYDARGKRELIDTLRGIWGGGGYTSHVV